jgi:uncharacterized protein YdeI (BOF family)
MPKRAKSVARCIARHGAAFLTPGLAIVLVVAQHAHAQVDQGQLRQPSASATSPSTPRPDSQPDASLISISGTVGAVTSTAFTLDYGRGRIDVELDDVDPQPETQPLRTGDHVTVHGRIDDDFFAAARVEASSVYVERLGTHLFASDIDEEELNVITVTPASASPATIRGTVSEVRAGGFTLDSADRSVFVSVEAMEDNPLDRPGNQRIQVGDTVVVQGTIEDDFLQHRRIDATAVDTVVEGVHREVEPLIAR